MEPHMVDLALQIGCLDVSIHSFALTWFHPAYPDSVTLKCTSRDVRKRSKLTHMQMPDHFFDSQRMLGAEHSLSQCLAKLCTTSVVEKGQSVQRIVDQHGSSHAKVPNQAMNAEASV